jgi:SAM-dependent methyltransferase
MLEVGSRDVNGTVRPVIEALRPASYLGVDIEAGPGVDELCDVSDLVDRYGEESFDVVVSTELVEHVRNWREAFEQMKRVLRPGGVLLITTRSVGFRVHGYPYDFWRYEPDDMRAIFADMHLDAVASDRVSPGVFTKAVKPRDWRSPDLRAVALYSVVTKSRLGDVTDWQVRWFMLRYEAHRLYRRVLPEAVRASVKAAAVRLPPSRNHAPFGGRRGTPGDSLIIDVRK